MVGRVGVERLEGRVSFAAEDPDLAFGGGDAVASPSPMTARPKPGGQPEARDTC